jgi:hypothetical protein
MRAVAILPAPINPIVRTFLMVFLPILSKVTAGERALIGL